VNCRNFHATKQDIHCPYCVIKILILALEKHDPHAPELSPAYGIIDRATKEGRRRECPSCEGLGVRLAGKDVAECASCEGQGTL
jgi:hypothetical protein